MELQNQQRVKEIAEKYGPENVVIVLGSSDAEGASIYAETVTAGDPTFAGPLAGVQLGLAVYHIFDPVFKEKVDPNLWEDQLGMMEMVLDVDSLVNAVAEMRKEHSKYVL